MEGVNKLTLAIERVGFVARQFALWVVPRDWFISDMKPDFGEEGLVVCFHHCSFLFFASLSGWVEL